MGKIVNAKGLRIFIEGKEVNHKLPDPLDNLKEDPCAPTGCIYYTTGEARDYCAIRYEVCPYGNQRFATTGDIKRAIKAWGHRARIQLIHIEKEKRAVLTIWTSPKSILWLSKSLSNRLSGNVELKIRPLSWWRCWLRKVQVI